MKSIKETIIEALNESADKKMKELFGKEITFSPTLKSLFSKLGMNHLHSFDRFVVFEDGCVEYSNEKLFTGVIAAKVKKGMLNRIIIPGSTDLKIYNKSFTDQAPEPYIESGAGESTIKCIPYNLLRAVLNALTMRQYTTELPGVIITDLDYTKGDFSKDTSIDQ